MRAFRLTTAPTPTMPTKRKIKSICKANQVRDCDRGGEERGAESRKLAIRTTKSLLVVEEKKETRKPGGVEDYIGFRASPR
jgi:hypothetical protein